MAGQAFRRSTLITNAFAALSAMGLFPGSKAYEDRRNKIPAYFSRGKGGKKARTTGHSHMALVRKSRTAHNIAKRK